MPTIIDLGQKVKQKYPGQYDDLSDVEVGQKVKAKYPGSYDDFTDVQEVGTKKEKSLFEQAGDFLKDITGIGGVARGVSEAAKVAKGLVTRKEVAPSVTPKQFTGSVGKLGLTAATLAGGPATLGARIAVGGAIGAGLGASEALEKGRPITSQALLGGITGAALPVVGAGLTGIGRALTVKGPKQLINYALRVPSKKAQQGIAEAFLEKKLGGKSLGAIESQLEKEVDNLDDQIMQALRKSKDSVLTKSLFTDVSNAVKSRTGSTISSQELRDRVARFVPDHAGLATKTKLTLEQANLLRRAIDKNLKEATFLGKELTGEQQAVRSVASALRGSIQGKSGTQQLFKDQSKSLRILNVTKDAINKSETQGRPGLLDITAGGFGFATGGPIGLLGGVAAQRIARSPQFQTLVAQTLRGSIPISQALSRLDPASRLLFLNLVLQGTGSENQPQ